MKSVISLVIAIMLISNFAFAGDEYKPHFSGYMFGDMYLVAANHDSSIVGSDGFWFRRIYFTFDQQIQPDMYVRLRMEMASPGNFSSTSSALVPFVKDAYLRWKYTKGHELYLGISEPPTIKLYEKSWGHRYIEKTPLDLQKMASSRDFGIALKGNLTGDGQLKYHFMFGNGSGNKSEVNEGKKVMTSLIYMPADKWTLELYGDYNDNNGKDDFFTMKIFTSYHANGLSAGLMYASQTHQTGGEKDYNLDVFSAYATYKVKDNWTVIGRFDRNFNPNPAGNKISYLPFDKTAASNFIIAALEYTPNESVRLSPNVEMVIYDKNNVGVTPDTDIIPRLTFFYEFK